METNKKLKKGAVVSNDTIALTGFIQKIVPIFLGLFNDFPKTTFDFQGPPTRNVISQTVQKCTFPVHSNRTF